MVEVDVAPAQSHQFGASKSGVGGQPPGAVVTVPGGAGQEAGEFACGPGHPTSVLVTPVTWRDRKPRRVDGKQSAGDSVVEDLAEQDVDLEYGLGGQAPGAVGTPLDEQVLVQVLDLFDA